MMKRGEQADIFVAKHATPWAANVCPARTHSHAHARDTRANSRMRNAIWLLGV